MIPFELPRGVAMQRIIWHWTAGGWIANATDRKAYHVLIQGPTGNYEIVKGVAGIERNSGKLSDGYAAHTLNCNTGSIGVSLCAMAGAIESPFNPGKYPITEKQLDILVEVLAELCQFFSIPVTAKTVLSHAEVQSNLGITQRNKWDIARLAFGTNQTAKTIGDDIRRRVLARINKGTIDMPIGKLPEPVTPPVETIPVPEGAQAMVATNGGNLLLRTGPGVDYDAKPGNGIPNGTRLHVLTIQPSWVEVVTPFGIQGWVARKWIELVDGPPVVEPTTPSAARQTMNEIRALLDKLEKEI